MKIAFPTPTPSHNRTRCGARQRAHARTRTYTHTHARALTQSLGNAATATPLTTEFPPYSCCGSSPSSDEGPPESKDKATLTTFPRSKHRVSASILTPKPIALLGFLVVKHRRRRLPPVQPDAAGPHLGTGALPSCVLRLGDRALWLSYRASFHSRDGLGRRPYCHQVGQLACAGQSGALSACWAARGTLHREELFV